MGPILGSLFFSDLVVLLAAIAVFTFLMVRGANWFSDLELCTGCLIGFGLVFLGLSLFHPVLMGIDEEAYAWHGAVLGGIMALSFLTAIFGQHVLRLSDEVVMIVLGFYVLYRWGCWIEGHCGGRPTDSFLWSGIGDVGTHPVQLYDSYLNLMLLLALFVYLRVRRWHGETTLLFLFGNSFIRFFMELFRWGASSVVVGGLLTLTQIVCLMLMLTSAYAYLHLSFKARRLPSSTLIPA